MMKKISVIVPLYHGEKYVGQIVKQIERNQACVSDLAIQLLLYNDCPEETICLDVARHVVEIQVLNAKTNAGIHGARVNALKQAAGEYILFLDQDDVIRDNYIESQYQKIGDADAVICRLINGKRLHYTDTFRFEEVVTKEFMLHSWCPIVSPGQVLLKKEAVPDIWKENILKNNGADDYFLWLCMMAEGMRFVLNQEVLFEHIITGFNTSENTNLMMDSEEEMICILERERVFPEYGTKVYDDLKRSLRRIHVKQLDTQRRVLACLNRINYCIREKSGIYDWIKKRKDKKIAIYGAGELGLALCDILEKQGMVISCYLDRNAKYILAKIPVYTVDEVNADWDCILVTILDQRLEEELRQKFACEVMDVEEISYAVWED